MLAHQFMTSRMSLLLLFSVLYAYFFININLYNCSRNCICIVFIVCIVSFTVCVAFYVVFRVLFCVMCVICVLCFIVLPLSPGKTHLQ
jgi:hypothetical protein